MNNPPLAPTFSVAVDGINMRCTITVHEDLVAPVFCFSLLIKPAVVSGGTLIKHVAGYGEALLPDLKAGVPHEVVVAYDRGTPPVNRAWLPHGAFLRRKGGTTLALPGLPSGILPVAAPPVADYEGLRLVPQPSNWAPSPGTCAAESFAVRHAAFARVDDLAQRNNMAPLTATNGVPVTVETADMAPGAYRIDIAPRAITLTAGGDTGTHYAAITLLNLRQTYAGKLPCGTILDAPRYGYRGMMLDTVRHFFKVETILRLLDLMAMLKLNRFHWHFADDEAFRVELPGHPDLAARTALRGEGHLMPGVMGGGVEAGGSYSQGDVRKIIAHAKALEIDILPEIEFPAHCYALTRLYPELADPGDNGMEVSVQDYPNNAANPSQKATWDLFLPLAAEVGKLFPLGILHLGGDELAEGAWSSSPAAHTLREEQGLEREDLQGWMMAEMASYLQERGIRTACWEEASRGNNKNSDVGGIGHDALIFSWTGQGAAVEAARKGHSVVMCPGQHVYLDMAHTPDPNDWGAHWAAFIDLEDTVNWNVVPKKAPDIADKIHGIQGCFWAEMATDDRHMEAMVAPRILGVACKAWEENEETDGPRLRLLAGAYRALFDTIDWDWHGGA